MNPGRLQLFPALHPAHPTASLQRWQTAAIGLLPPGLALFFLALDLPDRGRWAWGAWAALAVVALHQAVWPRLIRALRGRPGRFGWLGLVHHLVRSFFFLLLPWMAWCACGGLLDERGDVWPFAMFGILVALHPVERIAREAAKNGSPRRMQLRETVVVAEIWAGLAGVAGLLSGAILEAHKDYPTDPTILLLALWVAALLAAGAALLVLLLRGAERGLLFNEQTNQPLDDEPETPPPPPERRPSDEY